MSSATGLSAVTLTSVRLMSRPLDLARVGILAEDLEALEVVHQIDHRLAERLALAGEQEVHRAEDVLVVQRRDQALAGLGRARRAALGVVVAEDLGDGERAGADDRHDGHGGADDDALRPLALRLRTPATATANIAAVGGPDGGSRRSVRRRRRAGAGGWNDGG